MASDTSRTDRETGHFDLVAGALQHAAPAAFWQRLQSAVLGKGIEIFCGRDCTVDARVAAQIPIVSAATRMAMLRTLGLFGRRAFVTRSGLGHDFLCHIGDLAEFPFYHRRAYEFELELVAAWLQDTDRPVIYDVGANTGFVAGHLAQMLARRQPRIHAFEPVPTTFAKLVQGVQRLDLAQAVFPVPLAVSDEAGPVRLSYSDRRSLLAQVTPGGLNRRVGDGLVAAQATTLDAFCATRGEVPHLVKIDVEGSEPSVLRGARALLSRDDRPALLFEHNPVTLAERGATLRELAQLLHGYAFHYVDDLSGQKMPFGTAVADLERIDWICNLFAVPAGERSAARWREALARARFNIGRRGKDR